MHELFLTGVRVGISFKLRVIVLPRGKNKKFGEGGPVVQSLSTTTLQHSVALITTQQIDTLS